MMYPPTTQGIFRKATARVSYSSGTLPSKSASCRYLMKWQEDGNVTRQTPIQKRMKPSEEDDQHLWK
uniref:Uncharacterized protein n=1 Tax=Caenorhabditis japonica TaxID=281687 RepID=A0A8R1IIW9_CAEJA